MATVLRSAYLTGPNGYRSALMGNAQQRRTRIGYAVAVAQLLVILLMSMSTNMLVGLGIGGVIGLVIVVLVNPTVSGDLLGKTVARYRWRTRVKRGVDRFIPYSEDEFQRVMDAGGKGVMRTLSAYRQMPDGCAGMGWLRAERNTIGIAWHEPLDGSMPYLSVAFEVDGRMRGFESIENLNASTQRWGAFLASLGGDFSLCRYVQVLTRILPPNTALHEAWARDHIDMDLINKGQMGRDLLASYDEVIAQAASIGTVQRHFVVVRYDLDGDFIARAKRFGPDIEGWRELMDGEIAALARGLSVAGMGHVRALTARQVAAFIRHSQSPSLELDRVADIDVTNFGVKSYDTRAMCVTRDEAPANDGLRWYSATARIEATNVDAGRKNMFWINGWLVDMPEPIVRTMSFHVRVIPARIARALARQDETADAAEVAKLRSKGSIATKEPEAQLMAVNQRGEDLKPGSGHHGIEWMGFVTVTAASPEELERHTRMIAERASTALGVRRLEWCRDVQSVAAGYTWPIARALRPHSRASIGSRVEGAIARMDMEGDLS